MSEFIEWLTSTRIPSIRYLTLRELLHHPPDSPEVVAAKSSIMNIGPVPEMLSQQTAAGHWSGEHSYYTPKYTSTHWSMMLLAELHADGHDARIQQGVSYMLDHTHEALSNCREGEVFHWTCLWGKMVRYAIVFGYQHDERVQELIPLLAESITNNACLCRYNGKIACAWGVVDSLWALAAIPEKDRSPQVNAAIKTGLKFLLQDYNLTQANYPNPANKVHPIWFNLNFPVFYQSDILFTLRMLMALNALDSGEVIPALDWLEAKRGENEHWRGSSPFRARTWRSIADKDEVHRWVSLYSALILQHAGRDVI